MCTVQGVGLKFLGTGGNFLYDGSPVFGGALDLRLVYVVTVRLQFTKVSYTVNQLVHVCTFVFMGLTSFCLAKTHLVSFLL